MTSSEATEAVRIGSVLFSGMVKGLWASMYIPSCKPRLSLEG